METQIVKIDHTQYGIEESKATQIAQQFKPMLDKMILLESEYNEVVQLPIEDKSASAKAKELRLKYVKVRTGTAEIHKQQKAFYLAAGRFIDGWKNAQLFASEGIEEKLQSIENYHENIEKERIKKLTGERLLELQKYDVDGATMGVGQMSEDVWNNFLSGTKLQYESKKAAEAKAESDRLEKERAEAAENERVRKENARLKEEAAKKEAALIAEREKADKILEAQRKSAADKLAKEKAASDAKLKAEQEESARLKAELLAKEKAEQEIKDKAAAEAKAKEQAEAKAKKAPDKIKIKAAIDLLPELNCSVTSDEGEAVFNGIRAKFEAFKEWANSKINTL